MSWIWVKLKSCLLRKTIHFCQSSNRCEYHKNFILLFFLSSLKILEKFSIEWERRAHIQFIEEFLV